MSRPKPVVLMQHVNKKTFKTTDVLDSDAIWAVFYKGHPINLRSSSIVARTIAPKYKKVSFSNKGHAFNLASKLNSLFSTNDFKVFKLVSGEEVNESED